MTNSNKEIVMPTLEIRRLLKLRGISQKDLAEKANISYFMLSKFLTQVEYITRAGVKNKYKVPHIRKALSEALSIPHDDLFGEKGQQIVRQLIADEIVKGKQSITPKQKKEIWSLKLFIKNFIQLGRRRPYLYEKD